jgi:hypothetical protein
VKGKADEIQRKAADLAEYTANGERSTLLRYSFRKPTLLGLLPRILMTRGDSVSTAGRSGKLAAMACVRRVVYGGLEATVRDDRARMVRDAGNDVD